MAWQAGGVSCALAIVTGVKGGSMRGPGALMAINETGDTAGYISGGCVDGDIAARAQGAITRGENIDLRYGDGSPFKDIALPCGGSIDVLLLGRQDREIVTALSDALAGRQGLTVYANAKTGLSLSDSGGFKHIYQPKLRLQIAGRGAAMAALARQADAA